MDADRHSVIELAAELVCVKSENSQENIRALIEQSIPGSSCFGLAERLLCDRDSALDIGARHVEVRDGANPRLG
jgi:hypothetical protein